MVRLGQAEAADHLAGGELGQIFLALRLGAVGIDRMHHQRRLHRQRRAVAGIDALDLARDQAVGDIAEARAAIFLRDGRAEQPERAHLGQQVAVDLLLAIGLDHPRHQLVLRKAARGVAHHALLFGQLAFEIERILPVEMGVLDGTGILGGEFFCGLTYGPLLTGGYLPDIGQIFTVNATLTNRMMALAGPRDDRENVID